MRFNGKKIRALSRVGKKMNARNASLGMNLHF